MAKKIDVTINHKVHSYPIEVGHNLNDSIQQFLKTHCLNKKKVWLVDANVQRLHVKKLKHYVSAEDLVIEVPSGEGSKSRQFKTHVENQLLEASYNRNCIFFGVGGGVCTDVTGFIAATFMRGVPFVQIPTTLLSMVDASLGGKTGINVPQGKNLIGSFYQPQAVFSDLNFLQTLPKDEYLSGLSEIVKVAIAFDKPLFEKIESHSEAIVNQDSEILEDIIVCAINLKKQVVQKDPHEKNLRKVLNFGHTFAHALEAHCNYQMLHGYAVAVGMAMDAWISLQKKHLKQSDYSRIVSLLKDLNLPYSLKDVSFLNIKQYLLQDKKNQDDLVHTVLIESIGQFLQLEDHYSVGFSLDDLQAMVESIRND